MYFGEKIRFVYENYEVLRYKVGMMEDYLGIQRVHASSTREEKKRKKKMLRGIYSSQILRRLSDVLLSVRKVLAIL